MANAVQVFYCLLLILGTVTAQAGKVERALPNWLTGIIAVAVFLFLVFVAFIVNKAWCKGSSQEEKVSVATNEHAMTNGSNTNLDSVRSHEHNSAYENVTFHKSEETVTVM
ncbi:PDZK1-interacting protein 1 [Bagarius yarrelli]|uniref:PDZK1-interacting protein 1 n=1 Tax=Bagarius yarrelli TaxID=175774 RepID=A0A556TS43_BAGYA|nr:PDZK1-interacting protein 1 [Bagarius yarrelli]